MKRPRIAHVVYSYLPVTQNWIYTQLRNATLCDHAVISLIEDHPDQFPWNDRFVAFPEPTLVSICRLLLARYWIWQPDRFFAASLRSVNPDVIHGHFSTEAWRIITHAQKACIPLITTFYGLDVDKLARRYYWKKRYPILFAYGSAFVVEGPFMANRLSEIGCSHEKIHIIPLGVDPQLYRQASSVKKSVDETVTVLFVGCHREKKGPIDAARIFIAAAQQCPQLRLAVVGNGKYRKRFETMIISAGLHDRVVFYGYCSFDTYRTVLASTDIVLVPSCTAKDGDSEGGAPVVCIEAQVSGIPVVGTRHCDIPFIVQHGESGLLSAEHAIDSMVRDLVTLVQDTALRLQFGACGRQRALRRHDIGTQAASLTELYQSLAGNTSRRISRSDVCTY